MIDRNETGPDDNPYGTHRYDDHQTYNIAALDRRIQFWELANGILCVLFLWAPMAAAAFHRGV